MKWLPELPFTQASLRQTLLENLRSQQLGRHAVVWLSAREPGLPAQLAPHSVRAVVIDPHACDPAHWEALRAPRRAPENRGWLWIGVLREPESFGALRTLCHAWVAPELGRPAQPSFEAALALRSERHFELQAGLRAALRWLKQGRPEAAALQARELAARVPLAWEPWGLLAQAELQAGRLERARRALGRGLEIQPCSPRLHRLMKSAGIPNLTLTRLYCPNSYILVVR